MITLIQKQKYNKGIKDNGLIDFSGTRLANSLNFKISTPKIKPSPKTKLFINWGLTDLGVSNIPNTPILNHPLHIRRSSNKIETLRLLSANNIPSPIFFLSYREAYNYLEANPKEKIVCRTLINSTNGNGIVIAKTLEELVDCRLYTVYFPKKWEIRVHVASFPSLSTKDTNVAFGEVIHISQKRRLSSEELESRGLLSERSKYIRNLSNGYIYSDRLDSLLSPELLEAIGMHCLETFRVLELNFGAVDVLISKNMEYVILEVNSAPGLQGRTLEIYSSVFREELEL